MNIRVKATRNFTVGPARHVAIKAGEERDVSVDEQGLFHTKTSDGYFFGTCRLNDGWEVIKELP